MEPKDQIPPQNVGDAEMRHVQILKLSAAVLVLLVLTVLLIPTIRLARIKNAEAVHCRDLRQIYFALIRYEHIHGALPPMRDAAEVIEALSLTRPVGKVPDRVGHSEPPSTVTGNAVPKSELNAQDYQPNPILSGVKLADVADRRNTVAFYKVVTEPDGNRAVLFLDGTARIVSATQWVQLKGRSGIP